MIFLAFVSLARAGVWLLFNALLALLYSPMNVIRSYTKGEPFFLRKFISTTMFPGSFSLGPGAGCSRPD